MTKIYLISPPKIDLKSFSTQLNKALQTKLVPIFQLRLKDYSDKDIEVYTKELIKICRDNNCLFILNDNFELALNLGCDGVHLGADDINKNIIKNKPKNFPKNFLMGSSCYDSKHLAMESAEMGFDYLSFGAFFESKTKISRGKPDISIINWASEILNLPVVAIGGINANNCGIFAKNNIDLIAVISFVWEHSSGVKKALEELEFNLKSS